MKGLFIVVFFLMSMFVSNISFAGGMYDSVIIMDINDVNQAGSPGYNCVLTIVYNVRAIKNGVIENKQIVGTMTSANLSLNLSDYLKINNFVFNKKAEQDGLEMYSLLCKQ